MSFLRHGQHTDEGEKGKNNGKTSGSSSAIVLAKGKQIKSATAIDAIVRKPMGGRVRVMRQRQQHSATKKKQSEMDEMYWAVC